MAEVNVIHTSNRYVSNLIDWDSQRGDLIKRAYWHCVIMET